MTADDAPIEIETGPQPAASIIWLHGLGADGHDFEPIVPELGLSGSPAVRFVFPHAPYRPVTVNGGATMRAWYDIAMDARGYRQDEAHIRDAEQSLRRLIAQERERGIDSRRIVLAGFSQGADVGKAIHEALNNSGRPARLIRTAKPHEIVERSLP